MPNEVNLRAQKVSGRRFTIVAESALLSGPLLVILGWPVLGPIGLAAAILVLNVTVLIAISGLQSQIDAIEMATRGVRDESDYSTEIRMAPQRLPGEK